MKKSIFGTILLLLICCIIFCACNSGGTTNNNSKDNGLINYKVNVVDGNDAPVSDGVVVRFMQGDKQVAMQKLNNGVAEKELAKDEYSVELKFTDDENAYYYDSTNLKINETNTEVKIVLLNKIHGDPTSLYFNGKDYNAYRIGVGGTYITVTAGERNFFIFTPTEEGKYEFYVEGDGVTLGYYGAPHYVMDHNAEEPIDGKFTVNIKESMIGKNNTGTSEYVLGLDSEQEKNVVLKIVRIDSADRTIEDEPWDIYEKSVELSAYTLPTGTVLKNFDLKASTDTYKLVFNETDGFYHLNSKDGALVYVNLVKDNSYIGSFSTILENAGVAKYFYDEDGKFVKKEGYNECLLQYIEVADETEGVYPLTKDLEYIIKQAGDNNGWFEDNNPGYIFDDDQGVPDTDINPDISWLFMCCYEG